RRESGMPACLPPLEGAGRGQAAEALADRFDETEFLQLGQGSVAPAEKREIGVAIQVQLDRGVEVRCRPAVGSGVPPQAPVGQNRQAALLLLGLIEKTHQNASV